VRRFRNTATSGGIRRGSESISPIAGQGSPPPVNPEILVVGAHHIEPTLVPDVGYTEVIAVASEASGILVQVPTGREFSLGELMLYAIFKQMLVLGRHPRTFVRLDRRNARSLALCDRVGLSEEHPDQDERLIQRWGELPRHE
jgi:hypothetical protein